ncbi:zinc finger protein 34-like [Ambystoma mexicanum]|uniref:zinc finger protein 34-like n=1 Tax=Ambystoma mexicanum TaxID=8296 RepID=UPI0037E9054E
MSWQDADEVTFHDVSAYFSEEEWKLLHEWQKNLYRNVMKEIHQALISLGPLITTTVVSLRAKETEEPRLVDNLDSDRKRGVNLSPPYDAIPSPAFDINKEENVHLGHSQNTEGRKVNDCFSTDGPSRKEEESRSILIDHLGEEIRESSTDHIAGHELVLFQMKVEEEPYCVDHLEIKQVDHARRAVGFRSMNRKGKGGNTLKHAGKATQTSAGKAKMKLPHDYGAHSEAPQRPEIVQGLKIRESTHVESGVRDTGNLSFPLANPNPHASNAYNHWDSGVAHENLIGSQSNIQKAVNLYSCNECKKTFSKKEYLIRHKRKHMGARPYQCTECGKSFGKKDNLFVHKRTHTGERPYHCTMCDRRFSQKGVLNRHQITHMVERPYQCAICEKSFCQKGGLIRHQITHKTMIF